MAGNVNLNKKPLYLSHDAVPLSNKLPIIFVNDEDELSILKRQAKHAEKCQGIVHILKSWCAEKYLFDGLETIEKVLVYASHIALKPSTVRNQNLFPVINWWGIIFQFFFINNEILHIRRRKSWNTFYMCKYVDEH